MSRAASDTEDVRNLGLEALGREAEAVELLDLEAGAHERVGCLAGGMAATGDRWPDLARVEQLEQKPRRLTVRDHVLVEPQFSPRAQHAANLGEGALLIRNGAEHEARDGGVDDGVLKRELVGDTRYHPDRHVRLRGGRRGLGPQGRDSAVGAVRRYIRAKRGRAMSAMAANLHRRRIAWRHTIAPSWAISRS